GHKYGYVNFKKTKDESRNTLPFDFLTMGELFQNNHHGRATSPNFAYRWFEIDPTYQVMRLLSLVGVIRMGREKNSVQENESESATGGSTAVPELVGAASTSV
ncbi:MAG: acyl-CoA desaturase, partial [Leptospirales bacterium]